MVGRKARERVGARDGPDAERKGLIMTRCEISDAILATLTTADPATGPGRSAVGREYLTGRSVGYRTA